MRRSSESESTAIAKNLSFQNAPLKSKQHLHKEQKSLTQSRVFNLLFAFFTLTLLLPILLTLTLILVVKFRGRFIFSHDRIGLHGKVFKCYKFKTMGENSQKQLDAHLSTDMAAAAEWQASQKLKSDPRIAGEICQFLRRSSLDELPQLLNILIGDMNVIGPRPVTVDELERYGKDKMIYQSVRPGLTGQWQVTARGSSDYEERVRLDVDYIRSANIYLDMQILFKTFAQVLWRKGT